MPPADEETVGAQLTWVVLLAFLAGSEAARGSTVQNGLVSIPCLREVVSLHGVWHTKEAYLPIYADVKAVTYLASLGARAAADQAGLAILPVYSPEPVHFRQGSYIFLSTALILEAADEQTLLRAIQGDIPTQWSRRAVGSAGRVSACAAPALLDTDSFEEIRNRLARQISQYQDDRTPRLKRR